MCIHVLWECNALLDAGEEAHSLPSVTLLCVSSVRLFIVIQSPQSCPTLCHSMDCSTPAFPDHHHLLELAQTCVHWVGDAIQPSHPLSSPYSCAFNLFQYQGLFQWVNSLHHAAKVLEFQLQHQPFQKYSGLISFGIAWFDLLAVQRTLKNLLQHECSKASILWHSAFFMVQLSHPYMTTGKTIALTIRAFVHTVRT